jgi:hypothetical protein
MITIISLSSQARVDAIKTSASSQHAHRDYTLTNHPVTNPTTMCVTLRVLCESCIQKPNHNGRLLDLNVECPGFAIIRRLFDITDPCPFSVLRSTKVRIYINCTQYGEQFILSGLSVPTLWLKDPDHISCLSLTEIYQQGDHRGAEQDDEDSHRADTISE